MQTMNKKAMAFLLAISFSNANAVVVDSVDRIYDGDTITVTVKKWPKVFGDRIGVRIRGIDAPEIRGKCAKEKRKALEAKRVVVDMIKGGEVVQVEDIERGKYFRIVGDVYVDGVSVAGVLLYKGLARPYNGKTKRKGWC